MSFKDFLLEKPHESKGLDAESIKRMVPSYEKFMGKNHVRVGYYHDFEFLQVTERDTILYGLVDIKNEKIVCYVELDKLYNRSNHDIYQQTLIWRSRSINKDAIDFMRNQILDDINILVSDDIQSPAGRLYWKRLLRQYVGASRYEIGSYDQGKFEKFTEDNYEKEFDDLYDTNILIYLKEK